MAPLPFVFKVLLHRLSLYFFPHSSVGKESICNAGDLGSIPESGRSPEEGNGNPLQYSCLENPMDKGAWRVTVHGVARVGHDLVAKPHFFLILLLSWLSPPILVPSQIHYASVHQPLDTIFLRNHPQSFLFSVIMRTIINIISPFLTPLF